MRTGRGVLAAAIAITGGFFGALVIATTPAHATCTNECYAAKVGSTGTPDYSEVKWTVNAGGWLIQDRSTCRNAQVQVTDYKSGPVKAIGVWTKANCTAAYPQIITASYRLSKDNGTTWSAWVAYWQL